MSWDLVSDGFTITVSKNGETHEDTINGSKSVGDAVRETARKYGLSSVIVKNASGTEITPSDENKTMSEVGNLELVPKVQGAM